MKLKTAYKGPGGLTEEAGGLTVKDGGPTVGNGSLTAGLGGPTQSFGGLTAPLQNLLKRLTLKGLTGKSGSQTADSLPEMQRTATNFPLMTFFNSKPNLEF